MTSYGGLFNANTFFDEPNLILLDDAHAAENYLAGFWTVAVGREEHQALYGALVGHLPRGVPYLWPAERRGDRCHGDRRIRCAR